jgi:hypothetical protein
MQPSGSLPCALVLCAALAACSNSSTDSTEAALAGYVFAHQGPEDSSGSARFFGADTIGSCAIVSVSGDCQLVDCSGKEVVDNVSAGKIRLSGAADLALDAQDDGSYAGTLSAALLADVGEPLTIEASGDTSGVPAFRGKLLAPLAIEAANVNGTTASTLAFAFSDSLIVRWPEDPTADAYAGVELRSEQDALSVECGAPASQGSLEVPPDLLGELNGSPWQGELTLGVQTARRVQTGNWAIDLSFGVAPVVWQLQLE